MKLPIVARLVCGTTLSVGVLALVQPTAGAITTRGVPSTSPSTAAVVRHDTGRTATTHAGAGARSLLSSGHVTWSTSRRPTLSFAHRYGMVPLRRGTSASTPQGVAGSRSIPCEITCSAIRMSYFGGPVLSSAKVEGVFWGTGNFTAGAGPGGEMPAFYTAIGGSDWWAGLTEYNTTLTGGTNQIIASVSSLGETTITPSAPNDGSTITDAEMQNELAAQITAGHLPAPTLDSTGNVETDYALYFPDSKTECIVTGECNTNVFCAYHNSFSYNGLDVPYMVLPAFTPGTADASGCGTLPDSHGRLHLDGLPRAR